MVAARRATRRRVEGTAGDDGFSLIELLVVIAILPIVLGGIAMALVSVLSLQNSVSNRVGDSNDALVASTNFNRDIESAQMLTTQSTAACGTASQTQLLGAEWGANSSAPGGYDTVVSYISTSGLNPQTHTTNYTLTRQVCTFGTSTTPAQTTTLAHDVGMPTVTIYGPATSPGVFANLTAQNPNPFANWYTSQNVTSVVFGVNAPNSSYSYSLVGLPGQSKSQGSVSNLTTPAPNPGCGFATTGSGTYANQLCFADFTGYNGTLQSSGHCQTMTRPIAGTPYTLSFCLAVSSNNVGPAVIPTYYNPSGYDSEAYLGNNGFYTGIPGDPALYHTTSNSPYTAAYFTNIQVLDAAGQPSSGWTLVTGDAESTDTNEWMEFTSNLTWSILPNNGASDLYGNSCYDDKNANNSGLLKWTGATPATPAAVGTPSNGPPASSAALTINPSTFATNASAILCESDQQLNKTGALMLQAQEPTGSSAAQNLTVAMQGAGLEGLFLGVLL